MQKNVLHRPVVYYRVLFLLPGGGLHFGKYQIWPITDNVVYLTVIDFCILPVLHLLKNIKSGSAH